MIAITSAAAAAGCAREVEGGATPSRSSHAPAAKRPAGPAPGAVAAGAPAEAPAPPSDGPDEPDEPDEPDDATGGPRFGRAIGNGDGTAAAIHIVSRVAGGADPADGSPKRVRADQGVELFAVVEAAGDTPKRKRYFSDAGQVRIGGKLHDAEPLADGPAVELAWMRVEPVTNDMSNTATGEFRFETIAYAETAITVADRTGARVAADVRPTLTPNHGDAAAPGIGTMRYRLHARTADGRILSSPGDEARQGSGAGGLSDAVARISLRRDDSYLGYLTEMYGQPYIWASAGTTSAKHQSERLEGSDCADFIVYAARRMGKDVEYTWTGSLHQYTQRLGKGTLREDGVYVDARGKPLAFPAVGDIILFPRHVGALVEDRGTAGVLDTADLMMHTLFDSPKEEAIATSGYAETAVELHRWKR
jgi:hypothetical protein